MSQNKLWWIVVSGTFLALVGVVLGRFVGADAIILGMIPLFFSTYIVGGMGARVGAWPFGGSQ